MAESRGKFFTFRSACTTTARRDLVPPLHYVHETHLQYERVDASPLLHADFPRLHGNAPDLFYGTSRVRASNVP